eukprot:TRINITY_DN3974_c0_g1_i1.p1 TRINITY_DN3974_c0_g1~~TRINITY_DN3974_c0_g1_i1.p1  ORF type:complete len:457 (+),score=159.06 TRINITY_DN3974_c0_g1_i1:25-1395(+)
MGIIFSKKRADTKRQRKLEKKAALLIQTQWRAHKMRSAYKNLKRRINIIKEICSTERSYVQFMGILVNHFLMPLRESMEGSDPVLTKDQFRQIFSVTEMIYQYHKDILVKLEQKTERITADISIADIFFELAPFLSVYSQYANNSDQGRATIYCLNGSTPQFSEIVKRGQIESQTKESLLSLLIMPIQRIPRYLLLLREVIKYMEPNHPDCDPLKKAYAQIEETAGLINSRKADWERFNDVIRVSQLMKMESLVNPQRRLLWEADVRILFLSKSDEKGVLQCIQEEEEGGHGKKETSFFSDFISIFKSQKTEEFTFLWFNDQIILCKKKIDSGLSTTSSARSPYKLAPKKTIPFSEASQQLDQCPLEIRKFSSPKFPDIKNALLVQIKDQPGNSMLVAVKDEYEQDDVAVIFGEVSHQIRQSLASNLRIKTINISKTNCIRADSLSSTSKAELITC